MSPTPYEIGELTTRLGRLWSPGGDLRLSCFSRSDDVSGRLHRLWVRGVSTWGTEGRELRSRQPDRNNPVYLTGLDHDRPCDRFVVGRLGVQRLEHGQ